MTQGMRTSSFCAASVLLFMSSSCVVNRGLGEGSAGSSGDTSSTAATSDTTLGDPPPLTSASAESGTAQTGETTVGPGSDEESSGLSSGGETESESDEGLCGDGVRGPNEECDDGDARDGNGCNTDCVLSGSLLWRLGQGLQIKELEIAPDDVIHTLGQSEDGGSAVLTQFLPTGDIQDQQVIPGPYAGQSETSAEISELRIAADGSAVMSVGFSRYTPEGVLKMQRTQRLGDAGWIFDSQIGFYEVGFFRFEIQEDDVLLGIRYLVSSNSDVFESFSPTGGLDISTPLESWDRASRVIAGPEGSIISSAHNGIIQLDSSGLTVWESPPQERVFSGQVLENGDTRIVGSTTEEVFQQRFFVGLWNPSGTMLELALWPEDALNSAGRSAAIDADGNVAFGLEDSIVKLDPNLELLWEQEGVARAMAFDSVGTLVVVEDGTIAKYAP